MAIGLFFGLPMVSIYIGQTNSVVLAAPTPTPVSQSGGTTVKADFKPLEEWTSKMWKDVTALGSALAVLVIVFAAYRWIMSFGNPEQIKHAKELLWGAISGLVLLLTARAILEFISGQDIANIIKQK